MEKTTGRTEISELGEFGLIKRLTKDFKLVQPSSLKGVGDDAAVIEAGDGVLLATTDLLLEGIHFDLVYTPLKHLGYKAIAVNLSDICAMNGTPRQVLVSIGVSSKFPVEALDELYAGIRRACEHYGVDLVGGDTSGSVTGLAVSVTALGYAAREEVVYRSGAREGDVICVSGDLGGAYAALLLMEREKHVYLENPQVQPDLEGQQYIVGRLLKPEARVDIVKMLKDRKVQPHAMIDVSDGVSSDMLHICEQSGTGCVLYEEKFPIDPHTYQMALRFNTDPVTCFLNGGEDYELLFTLSTEDYEKIKDSNDITSIGFIASRDKGCKLVTRSGNAYDLKAQGWDGVKEKN